MKTAAMHIDQHAVLLLGRDRQRRHHPHRHARNRRLSHVRRIQLLRHLTRPGLPFVCSRAPLLAASDGTCASDTTLASIACASGLIVFGTGTTRVTYAVPSGRILLLSVIVCCSPETCAAAHTGISATIIHCRNPTLAYTLLKTLSTLHRNSIQPPTFPPRHLSSRNISLPATLPA